MHQNHREELMIVRKLGVGDACSLSARRQHFRAGLVRYLSASEPSDQGRSTLEILDSELVPCQFQGGVLSIGSFVHLLPRKALAGQALDKEPDVTMTKGSRVGRAHRGYTKRHGLGRS